MTTAAPPEPSQVRAWFALVGLSLRRQARARQMVWIALGLLVFACAFVAIRTAAGGWKMHRARWRSGGYVQTYEGWIDSTEAALLVVPPLGMVGPQHHLIYIGVLEETRKFIKEERTAVPLFTNVVVQQLFLGFLLPVWSLAFATEAFGGDRENNSLVWVLSRPLPRPAIYLARFVAMLPWSLALNVGGFAALCLIAGAPGRQALALFWPTVVWTTLAFCSLFHLVGALFRRPAIIACVYVFFLEIILNMMPGYIKRVSISFYARCMVVDAGSAYNIAPINPFSIGPVNRESFLPVTGATALGVLITMTVLLLALGTVLFSRKQFQDTGV
jgi:ABC-type transport system involved in multi-copper enzyme maturation permease subunit